MPEASSVTDAAVDIASRLKRIEDGSNRLYHRDFLGLSWLAGYAADVDMVCAEVERLKAQVTEMERQVARRVTMAEEIERRRDAVRPLVARLDAQAEVIAAARLVYGKWCTDPSFVGGLGSALARLDALELEQRKAVTQLQADMEAKA